MGPPRSRLSKCSALLVRIPRYLPPIVACRLLLPTLLSVMFVFASTPSAETKPPPREGVSSTFGKPATAFAPDCLLILFGKEIPTVSENGKRGYRIVKSATSVAVNGREYLSADDQLLPTITPSSEAKQAADIMLAAADLIWDSKRVGSDGSLVIAGKPRQRGEPFSVTEPQSKAAVEVTISEDGLWMWISHAGDRVFFPTTRPTVRPVEEQTERRLDAAYRRMIHDLRPGRLVVKGGSYVLSFPLSRASAVMEALARIPSLAEFEHYDNYGRAVYKPIHDGEFTWTSGIIRDFLR